MTTPVRTEATGNLPGVYRVTEPLLVAGMLAASSAEAGEEPVEEPDWQERALCAQTDPEAFFPQKGGTNREAKRICAGCEVRAECLEYAHDERFGVWGGLSARERRRLRRAAIEQAGDR